MIDTIITDTYITKKNLVRVTLYEDTYVHGFIISQNTVSIIVSWVEDYHTNGYMYIAKKIITQIKHDKYDLYTQNILSKKGVKGDTLVGVKKLDDNDILLDMLMNEGRFCYVETAYGPKKGRIFDDTFGKVIGVDQGYCLIWECEADGIWKDAPKRLQVSKIVRIERGTEYLSTFSHHTKPLKQKVIDEYLKGNSFSFYEFEPKK